MEPIGGAGFSAERSEGVSVAGMLLVNDSEERWRFPWMMLLIIAGCGAVFWWEQTLGESGTVLAFREWGLVPAEAGAALPSGDKSGCAMR